MAEPDITGGGPQQMSFPGMPGGAQKGRSATAARLGAKVTVDGVEKLDGKFKSLLGTLRQVRTELLAINNGGQSVNGGLSTNASTSKLGEMVRGFQGMGGGGGGASNGGIAAGAFSLGIVGARSINDRTRRNQFESTGISATDARLSSMYGFNYRTAEATRFNFSGSFGGSRQEQQRASTLGFSYGQTFDSNMNFMRSMGNVVQASGGTMSIGQAAESAGDFLDPVTMRRASAMGITPGRVAGQVQNPLQTAQGYLDHYQRRRGVSFNEADFTNMASAGSTLRYDLKRMYGLDDSAVNQIQQAGMQNLQFRKETGANRNINFNNPDDLREIGLNEDVLGLRSTQLTTAAAKREGRFFASNEAAMNRRIGQEINIQDTLSDVENSFSALIGTLYQFENVIKGVMGALGGASLLGIGRGMMGGGAMGGMGGMGGVPIGSTPRVGTVGSRMTGGPSSPIGGAGAAGGMGMAAKLGVGAMGVGMMFGGMQMAGQGGAGNTIMGGAGMIAGGAALGSVVPGVGTAVGAGIGAGAAAATSLYTLAKSKDAGSVQEGRDEGVGMTDAQLIKSLSDYNKSDLIAARGGEAGPKQRGRYDVWAARRGALVAALLQEASQSGSLKGLSTQEANKVGRLIEFFSSDKTSDDSEFSTKANEVLNYTSKVKGANSALYRKYFGNADNPFSNDAIDTPQYKSLIMTSQQVVDAYITGGGSGDPQGVNTAGSSFPATKGVGPGNASWDKLDGRMKERLTQLISMSGGKIWVGEGWRNPEGHHEQEFFRRHYEDPNGSREYKGKRYTLRKGFAPLAPPGQSNHNIGLAADLQGDMDWLQQNAPKVGLKTFASVNNEPWHVQLAELANGFLGNGADQGTGESNISTGDQEFGLIALGGGMSASSGVGYSIASVLAGGVGSGGGFRGTAASTTAGMLGGGSTEPWTGGSLSAEQVATMAYEAGFRGQDLVNVVAIAKRESSYNPMAHNGNRGTGDNSYGLMQINMLGNLGPARLQQFGISKYEDLFDPMTNLRAAFSLYQQSGNALTPWGGYKGKSDTYNTDVAAAAQAVANAGIQGDPIGGAMRPDTPSAASGGININLGGIVIQSSGNANYDADAFVRAVTPKLEEVAGMLQKRSGG